MIHFFGSFTFECLYPGSHFPKKKSIVCPYVCVLVTPEYTHTIQKNHFEFQAHFIVAIKINMHEFFVLLGFYIHQRNGLTYMQFRFSTILKTTLDFVVD